MLQLSLRMQLMCVFCLCPTAVAQHKFAQDSYKMQPGLQVEATKSTGSVHEPQLHSRLATLLS